MGFSYTREGSYYSGRKKVAYGTYSSSGGSTGGDIITGLNRVDVFNRTAGDSSVESDEGVANADFPLASGTVTIVTIANEDGTWEAKGA